MNGQKEAERKPWVMPEWMEPFRQFICNTGGNSVEELMNDRHATFFNNEVRAALIVAVESQVLCLTTLHNHGLLKEG